MNEQDEQDRQPSAVPVLDDVVVAGEPPPPGSETDPEALLEGITSEVERALIGQIEAFLIARVDETVRQYLEQYREPLRKLIRERIEAQIQEQTGASLRPPLRKE